MDTSTLFSEVLRYKHRANPHIIYTQLRAQPVSRQADGTIVISGFDEVSTALADPRLGNDARFLTGFDPEKQPYDAGIVGLDPPEHTRLRALTMKHFGPPQCPGRVASMRGRIRELLDERLAMVDPSSFDLVAEIAYPIPVQIICDLLGVPPEDEPLFSKWSAELALQPEFAPDFQEPERTASRDRSGQELVEYLAQLIAKQKETGGDTLLAQMASGHGSDAMSEIELVSQAVLLLIGGHETTVNLITNTMLLLLRNPDQLAKLQADPSLVIGAIEEALRMEAPLQFRPRVARDTFTYGDVRIEKGTSVILILGAANRDPRRFQHADCFDITRKDNPHLSFAVGPHYCFGAPLGRLEAQVVVGELARRLVEPRLEIDPPPYRPMADLRGPSALRIQAKGIKTAEQLTAAGQ